jgi:hypothetical protein
VELLVAGARPQPIAPSTIRKLPQPGRGGPVRSSDTPSPDVRLPDGAGDPCPAVVTRDASPPATPPAAQAPARPAIVRPLTPESYKVQFTASRDTHDRLRRVQDLLRHSVPNGEVAVIFDRALTLLLEHLEKQKLAAAANPRNTIGSTARTRHVPAAVRRAVWARDEGRCAFVGTNGRCQERGFLEFHHVEPFATGGETTAGNLQLRCRAHNGYEATLYFEGSIVREAAATYDGLTRARPDRVRQILSVYGHRLDEGRGLDVRLVKACHLKHVPGHKSDVSDREWLRDLHSVGLLRGSFPNRGHRRVASVCAHRHLPRAQR